MTVKLNNSGYRYARELVRAGRVVLDDRDEWSEHRPSAQLENAYIARHGIRAYARWFLAIDDERDDASKARYKYPFGDLDRVHRCGVLSAEVRAAQYGHDEIEGAAAHLHGMLDALRAAPAGPR